MSSTPTLSDFACTKALWLKAGSSAIEISSAFTAPENSERDKLPTFTGLPSASLNSDSSFGRNALASMNRGIRITIRIKAPTTMAAIFILRFMRILRRTYPRLVGTMGWKVALSEHFISPLNWSLLIFTNQLLFIVPKKFRGRYRTALDLFLALGPPFVVDADRGLQFLLAFFVASESEQNLSPEVMNVGSHGVELAGRINRDKRLLIVLRPLVDFGQPYIRIQQARIAAQRL